MKSKFLSHFEEAYKSGNLRLAENITHFYYSKNPFKKNLYYYIFVVLSKRGKHVTLYKILYKASFLFPETFYIKELLAYTLSHHLSSKKMSYIYFLDQVAPLIQTREASYFMLYCMSTLFYKKTILDSASFYSTLSISDPSYKEPLFFLKNHLIILLKIRQYLEIRDFIKQENFQNSFKQDPFLKFFYYQQSQKINFFLPEFDYQENCLLLLNLASKTKQPENNKKNTAFYKNSQAKQPLQIIFSLILLIIFLFILYFKSQL